MVQILNWDLGDKSGDKAAVICAVVTLAGFLFGSLFVRRVIAIYYKKDLYEHKDFNKRYDALTEGLR